MGAAASKKSSGFTGECARNGNRWCERNRSGGKPLWGSEAEG